MCQPTTELTVCKVVIAKSFSHTYFVAFGFLGGKEVKEKGLTNVGLRDRE
jgi:hypothetical protein